MSAATWSRASLESYADLGVVEIRAFLVGDEWIAATYNPDAMAHSEKAGPYRHREDAEAAAEALSRGWRGDQPRGALTRKHGLFHSRVWLDRADFGTMAWHLHVEQVVDGHDASGTAETLAEALAKAEALPATCPPSAGYDPIDDPERC
jgi:hypothetical protein